MANKELKEVNVELGGVTYVMRPAFKSFSMLETVTGKGTMELLVSFNGGKIPLKDLAAIIWAGIYGYHINANEGQPMPLSVDQVGEAIMKGGVANFLAPAASLLNDGLMGDPHPDQTEKKKALPTTH